jgi:EcsC protein family
MGTIGAENPAPEVAEHGKFLQALEWAYRKAVHGAGVLDSAESLAAEYLGQRGSLSDQVDSLINWQTGKAGMAGFATGFGGVVVMPLTIPANLASLLWLQLRMIAAIARMGGYDPSDDKVKTLAFACLAGNATLSESLKQAGIQAGQKLTRAAIERLSFEIVKKINQAVGFRLVTKFGSRGAINLGKAIPIAGGVIGGIWDATSTRTIGKVAKKTFIISASG